MNRLLLLPLLFASLVLVASAATSGASNTDTSGPVRIGVVTALTSTIDGLSTMYQALLDGLQVATYHCNSHGGIGGRPVELVYSENGHNSSTAAGHIDGFFDNRTNISALFGLTPDTAIAAALPTLERRNLVLFGELSSGSSFPFSRNLVITRTTHRVELLAMVTELIMRRQLRRIGFAHTSGAGFADDMEAEMAARLASYGLNITGRFTFPFAHDQGASTGFDYDTAWAAFAAERPQALLLYAVPTATTARFVRDVATRMGDDAGAPFVAIMTTTVVTFVTATLAALPAHNRSNVTFLAGLRNAHAASDAASAVLFRSQFAAAASASSPTVPLYRTLSAYTAERALSLQALSSWMDATVMFEALQCTAANTSHARIAAAVFDRNAIYRVGDTVLGIYSDDPSCTMCERIAGNVGGVNTSSGASSCECRCNRGGRAVELAAVDAVTGALGDTTLALSIPLTQCNASVQTLARGIVYALPVVKASLGAALGARLLTKVSDTLHVSSEVPFIPIAYRDHHANSTAEMKSIAQDRFLSCSVGGMVALPVPAVVAFPVIQPFRPYPRLRPPFQPNVIFTQAPLEHEFAALAAFLYAQHPGQGSGGITSPPKERTYGSISAAAVHLVVADADGDGGIRSSADLSTPPVLFSSLGLGDTQLGDAGFQEMRRVFEGTLNAYLVRLASSTFAPTLSALASWLRSAMLPPSAYVLIVGLTSSSTDDEFAALDAFLGRNPTAIALLPFNTVQLHYESLLRAVAQPAHRERVVFATSLPPWEPEAAPTGAFRRLYKALVEGSPSLPRTPLAMGGAIIRLFLETLAGRLDSAQQILPAMLLDEVYKSSVVSIDSATHLGPYHDEFCRLSTSSSTSTECEMNFPTVPLRVTRLSTASGNYSAAFADMTVAVETRPVFQALPLPTASVVSTTIIVLAVVGAVLVTMVVIAGVVFCCCRQSSARDVRYAPKDPSQPLTLMFTDIQSSTSLWAEIPELMGPALDTHHALIRQLIAKHKGYEVKTIGDAFMIAFRSAYDAVMLARDLELTFYHYNWGTDEIDRCLREFELHFIADKEAEDAPVTDYAALTCYLSEEDYRTMWHGLRVRVGIHTGFGDIKLDEVTKGYDYYGTIANVAARVESAAYGGQVVLSDPAKKAFLEEQHKHSAIARGPGGGGASGGGGGSRGGLGNSFRFDRGAQNNLLAGGVTGAVTVMHSGDVAFTDLGYNVLRGVPEPMWLHQLENVPGRKFGPLRTEVAPVIEEQNSDSDHTSTTATNIESKEMQHYVEFISNILRTTFSTVQRTKRVTELKALCKGWRVKTKSIEQLKKTISDAAAAAESTFVGGLAQPPHPQSHLTPGSAALGVFTPNITVTTTGSDTGRGTATSFAARAGHTKKVADDDPYVAALAPKIAAVSLKKLPRAFVGAFSRVITGDAMSRIETASGQSLFARRNSDADFLDHPSAHRRSRGSRSKSPSSDGGTPTVNNYSFGKVFFDTFDTGAGPLPDFTSDDAHGGDSSNSSSRNERRRRRSSMFANGAVEVPRRPHGRRQSLDQHGMTSDTSFLPPPAETDEEATRRLQRVLRETYPEMYGSSTSEPAIVPANKSGAAAGASAGSKASKAPRSAKGPDIHGMTTETHFLPPETTSEEEAIARLQHVLRETYPEMYGLPPKGAAKAEKDSTSTGGVERKGKGNTRPPPPPLVAMPSQGRPAEHGMGYCLDRLPPPTESEADAVKLLKQLLGAHIYGTESVQSAQSSTSQPPSPLLRAGRHQSVVPPGAVEDEPPNGPDTIAGPPPSMDGSHNHSLRTVLSSTLHPCVVRAPTMAAHAALAASVVEEDWTAPDEGTAEQTAAQGNAVASLTQKLKQELDFGGGGASAAVAASPTLLGRPPTFPARPLPFTPLGATSVASFPLPAAHGPTRAPSELTTPRSTAGPTPKQHPIAGLGVMSASIDSEANAPTSTVNAPSRDGSAKTNTTALTSSHDDLQADPSHHSETPL